MRLAKSHIAALIALALIPAAAWSCKKDDDKDDDKEDVVPVTDENKADATEASASQVKSIMTKAADMGASLHLIPENRMRLRAAYAQARAQARLGQKMTQDDELPTQDYDLCALIEQYCPIMKDQEPTLEDGQTCDTTSCDGGMTMSCTSASETSVCNGETYTMEDIATTNTFACSAGDTAGTFVYAIQASMTGNLTGGSITSATAIACTVNLNMTIDLNNPEEQAAQDIDCESGAISCSIGGNDLSCEELTQAMATSDCQ